MILTHSTRITVQIVVDDDTGSAALVSLLVKFGSLVNEAALLVGDLAEAARFTNTVFSIGFKALAFGMGVKV